MCRCTPSTRAGDPSFRRHSARIVHRLPLTILSPAGLAHFLRCWNWAHSGIRKPVRGDENIRHAEGQLLGGSRARSQLHRCVSLRPREAEIFAVSRDLSGEVEAGWGKAHIGLDKTNPAAPTWGSHGIAVESCSFPCSGDVPITDAFLRIWIDDFTNHTLTAFSTAGKPLLQLGTNGEAGNGTDPLQVHTVTLGTIYCLHQSLPAVW